MKRSGKTNRDEPSDMAWAKMFLECSKLFKKAAGLNILRKLMVIIQKFHMGSLKD